MTTGEFIIQCSALGLHITTSQNYHYIQETNASPCYIYHPTVYDWCTLLGEYPIFDNVVDAVVEWQKVTGTTIIKDPVLVAAMLAEKKQ